MFLPGDMIVHSGDLCVEMYFVKKGRCAVLDGETTPTVVAEVRAGQYFGESALMKAQRHKHTVRSIDYCNLLVLRQQSFDIILHQHPLDAQQIPKFPGSCCRTAINMICTGCEKR